MRDLEKMTYNLDNKYFHVLLSRNGVIFDLLSTIKLLFIIKCIFEITALKSS